MHMQTNQKGKGGEIDFYPLCKTRTKESEEKNKGERRQEKEEEEKQKKKEEDDIRREGELCVGEDAVASGLLEEAEVYMQISTLGNS